MFLLCLNLAVWPDLKACVTSCATSAFSSLRALPAHAGQIRRRLDLLSSPVHGASRSCHTDFYASRTGQRTESPAVWGSPLLRITCCKLCVRLRFLIKLLWANFLVQLRAGAFCHLRLQRLNVAYINNILSSLSGIGLTFFSLQLELLLLQQSPTVGC